MNGSSSNELNHYPLWTVAIPIYNPDRNHLNQVVTGLKKAIGKRDDVEVIMVDDGSDNCNVDQLFEEVREKDVRFRLHKKGVNSGIGPSWNTCIEQARGKYLHILHQDDFVLEGYYEAMEKGFDSGEQIGAVFSRTIFMDKAGLWRTFSKLVRMSSGKVENCDEKLTGSVFIQCPSISVRRSVYDRVGGFDEELFYGLDWEMWIRIARHYDIWFEPQPYICWRNSGESETYNLISNGAYIDDLLKAKDKISDQFDDKLKFTVEKNIDNHVFKSVITNTQKLIEKGEIELAKKSHQKIKNIDYGKGLRSQFMMQKLRIIKKMLVK